MKTIQTDFLIIGSGFGAAAPALRLSRAGHNVLMVEKGPEIDPQKDLKQTQDPKHLSKYLKSVSGDNLSFTYAEGVGGGSTFYEMVSLRAPSLVFNRRDHENRRIWPEGLDRQSMDPYYDRAEKMLNVHQIPVSEVPKSGVAFSMLMKKLGYSCDRARYAVKGCVGTGFCVSGCIFGAKQSLHSNYLLQARKAGMQILANTEVQKIEMIHVHTGSTENEGWVSDLPYRFRHHCFDSTAHEELRIFSKVSILAAGTVGSARILLHSKQGLPRLSDCVGKRIAFNGSVKVLGILPEDVVDGDMFSGRSHPGMISYHFLKERGLTVSSAKPLPIVLTSSARLSLKNHPGKTREWGHDHVALMKSYRHRMIILYALGLTEDSAGLIKHQKNDIRPELKITDGIRRYYRETKTLLESILTDAGGQVIQAEMINRQGMPYEDLYFGTTHMVGSCKMADSRERGVVNPLGEVFGHPGLFVTDGAAIPGSLAVNTSLTILANAERISDFLVSRYS